MINEAYIEKINSLPLVHGVVHIRGDRGNCDSCGIEMTVRTFGSEPVWDNDLDGFVCNTCFYDSENRWATPLEKE